MAFVTEPVFNNHEAELPNIEWKWLTDAIERLDALCIQLQVTPLSKFDSYSRKYAINNLGEEYVLEIEEDEEAQEKDDGYYLPNGELLWHIEDSWFAISDGLKTTNTLLKYFDEHPDFWSEREKNEGFQRGIPSILSALKIVLEDGAKRSSHFHFQSVC